MENLQNSSELEDRNFWRFILATGQNQLHQGRRSLHVWVFVSEAGTTLLVFFCSQCCTSQPSTRPMWGVSLPTRHSTGIRPFRWV